MTKRDVTLQIAPETFMAMHDLAAEQENTISHIIEEIVQEHLSRSKNVRTRVPAANERLVFALQKLLFRDMAEATDWRDLDKRLRKHGYFLKISWGGLSLHTETSGQKLCHAHDLGFSYGTFVRRFGPGKPKDPREA